MGYVSELWGNWVSHVKIFQGVQIQDGFYSFFLAELPKLALLRIAMHLVFSFFR